MNSMVNLPKHAEFYIPHRAPMCLLDELIESKENGCIAKLTIREDLPFISEQGLPSWVGIEIMAQAIAMFGGIKQRLAGNIPKLGFLLGAKKFAMGQDFFAIGEELTVEIELEFLNRHQIGLFQCSIKTEKGTSTASILVSQPDDVDRIIQDLCAAE